MDFKKNFLTTAVAVVGISMVSGSPALSDHGVMSEQVVFGAGPSTVIVTEFFDRFEDLPVAEGFTFTVPPESVKHAGGIRASGEYVFGRTGRPLNEAEKAEGKTDIFLGRVPTGFVVGADVQITNLTLDQLQAVLRKEVTNWSDLGGTDAEIVVAGREKTEAVLLAMSPDIPALLEAEFDWEFKRDHNLVNFISSPAGVTAIGFGALANFEGQNTIEITEMQFGVPLGLVVDDENLELHLVKAAQEYAASDEWKSILPDLGFVPFP